MEHDSYRKFISILFATGCHSSLRIIFGAWNLHAGAWTNTIETPVLPSSILFTDEAAFSQEGSINQLNVHINTRRLQPRTVQQRFSVNAWAGIISDKLIESYQLSLLLDGPK